MKKKARTPLKSIRIYCTTVCSSQLKEVRLCSMSDCPLYIYRFGRNPSRSGIGGTLDKITRKNDVESGKTTK